MTDPIRLQNRLSDAFSRPSAAGVDAPGRLVMDPPPLSPEAAFTDAPRAEPAPRRPPETGPALLGGLGLIACAVALTLGHEAGLYAVAGGLGSVGAGAMLLHSLGRVRARPPAAQSAELQQDAAWSRDESRAIHESIHDALGDVVLTRALDGRILCANTVFRRLTGAARPEGRRCEALGLVFTPAGPAGRFEVTLRTAAGERIFLWHDVTARDPANGGLVIHSLARDVTEERVLMRAREEARRRAEAASEAKSRLLATVSHEIRTPLGGILGMANLLSRTRLSPEQASYLDGVRQSGVALGQLVDELLDVSAIEAGRFTLNPLVTEVRPFIEGVSEMLAHRAHAKGLEIGVTVDACVPERLEFDPARLRQVLFNLIGNAVKFTRSGGVLVAVALKGRELVIDVADTGPGMSEAERAAVFEEFTQAGDAGERSGGTGLGLSISARLMAALGGGLSVSAGRGTGSTFTVRLPVTAVAGQETDGRGARLAASHVLFLAPPGPAASATVATLRALGARCRHVVSAGAAAQVLEEAAGAADAFTDIIVDHRLSAAFARAVPGRRRGAVEGARRIFLVNPEERTGRSRGDFDAWLIRPLREKSLTDVLTGRLSGVEKREALNDNRSLPCIAPAAPAGVQGPGLTVLLAEDDPVNALLARSVLEKAGHRVSHAADFGVVLDAMLDPRAPRPGLLLTDLSMPGGEGGEVVARIREAERRFGLARVPVVVLTGDARRQAAERALLCGADAVLEKPASPERLLAEIARLCGARPGG